MSNRLPQSPLRILLVDRHELARYGLALALSKQPAIHSVQEAETGQEALSYLEKALEDGCLPDLVLMDTHLTDAKGAEITHLFKSMYPSLKVMMLTTSQESEDVLDSLAAGTDAYCLKEIRLETLLKVINCIAEGALWLDPSVKWHVQQAIRESQGDKHCDTFINLDQSVDKKVYAKDVSKKCPPASGRYTFTRREQQVIQAIIAGKSNQEIADVLNVTVYTAKAHVSKIIKKLGVKHRTQVAVKIIQEGFLV